MKITWQSIWAAVEFLLFKIDIHKYTPWARVGSHSYWYRTCQRCSEIETKQLVKGSLIEGAK